MALRLPKFAVFPSLFIFLLLVACAGGDEPVTANAGSEAASEAGEAGTAAIKMHWTNDQPIGLGMAGVDAAMLENGLEDPTQWLLYGGNYSNFRHSPIEELTPAAVPNLRVAWSFPTGTDRQFEVSPVVSAASCTSAARTTASLRLTPPLASCSGGTITSSRTTAWSVVDP